LRACRLARAAPLPHTAASTPAPLFHTFYATLPQRLPFMPFQHRRYRLVGSCQHCKQRSCWFHTRHCTRDWTAVGSRRAAARFWHAFCNFGSGLTRRTTRCKPYTPTTTPHWWCHSCPQCTIPPRGGQVLTLAGADGHHHLMGCTWILLPLPSAHTRLRIRFLPACYCTPHRTCLHCCWMGWFSVQRLYLYRRLPICLPLPACTATHTPFTTCTPFIHFCTSFGYFKTLCSLSAAHALQFYALR